MHEQRHLNSPLVCLFGPGFRVSFGVSLGLSFRVNCRLTHAPACAPRTTSINPFAADGTATLPSMPTFLHCSPSKWCGNNPSGATMCIRLSVCYTIQCSAPDRLHLEPTSRVRLEVILSTRGTGGTQSLITCQLPAAKQPGTAVWMLAAALDRPGCPEM
jgi:hypothetical protein